MYWQLPGELPRLRCRRRHLPRPVPAFPHFGRNGAVAWAITHGDADTQDLYLERFSGTRYLTPDGWQEAAVRQERIEVRGSAPVTVPVWVTRHGPVVHGNPEDGLALTLKLDRDAPGQPRPRVPAAHAHRGQRGPALAAAQDGWVDPVNNLVCADTGGHIAYQCRGELPVRTSDAGRRLPAVGWDDSCEWTGTVPFARLPATTDPGRRVRDDRQQRHHRRRRAVHLPHVLPALAG